MHRLARHPANYFALRAWTASRIAAPTRDKLRKDVSGVRIGRRRAGDRGWQAPRVLHMKDWCARGRRVESTCPAAKHAGMQRNIMRRLARAALAASLAVAAAGHAATDSTTFKVKIVITESCSISTTAPSDVVFGTVARTSTTSNYDAAGALNVNCSAGTPYAIGLTGGANSTGTPAAPAAGDRRMKHATASVYVPYDLYQNSTRTTFWGNGTANSLSGTGTGASVAVPVYGRLTNVNFAAGSYEDTVTATITY